MAYVDDEPTASTHAALILENGQLAKIIRIDLRNPVSVPTNAEATGLLNMAEPAGSNMTAGLSMTAGFNMTAGLSMTGVFHPVAPEADVASMMCTSRDALALGSDTALRRFTADIGPDEVAGLGEVMSRSADRVISQRTLGWRDAPMMASCWSRN